MYRKYVFVYLYEWGLMDEDLNDRNNWRKKIIQLSNSLMDAGRCANIVRPAK
jgi:hypothetical protein